MKKWMAIPALAGAVVLGGVAMVANADKSDSKSEGFVTVEEAETKAVETVGGKVTEVEYDKSDEKFEVEVEADGVEYELDINATTGEVINKEADEVVKKEQQNTLTVVKPENNKKKTKTKASKTNLITAKEAIAIAMKHVNGTVKELELDDDDGRAYYEIEIKDGKYEYEFEIDAITGEILEFEKERDDD